MGCENIQSFTIPGAVFAQIWGGAVGWEGGARDGRGQNEGWEFFWCFFFLKKKNQAIFI